MIQQRPRAVLDVECYINYFLIGLKNIATGKVVQLEMWDGDEFQVDQLRSVLAKYTVVTFNGNRYDVLMIKGAIKGMNCAQLKKMSDDIIVNQMKPWDVERKYALPPCSYIDHIDLIEVAPGKVGLKTYMARIHSRRLQELPIEPDAVVTKEQGQGLATYNVNDLDGTIDLYNELVKQIDLRVSMSAEYGLDLRSKSDAQIAEAVIKAQLEKIKGERIWRPEFPSTYSFKYVAPAFIRFRHPELRNALAVFTSVTFGLNEKGEVAEPEEVGDLLVKIGESKYQLGIGGIHSCEKSVAHLADNSVRLYDRDVTSYYPNIILNQRLCPEHLGQDFLTVYKSIVDRRIKAKKSGDKVTDAALKITINGSFGKLGSKWSVLFAPRLMVQVTVTGQLSLLMLIEALEEVGIQVVSANTDGIVIKCRDSLRSSMLDIIAEWERVTGFNTEETEYSALYSRDINNYIALKTNGSYKVKGTFADPNLAKTPTGQVCVKAAVDWLQFGLPVEKTISLCRDIRQFVHVRNVTGGGVKGQSYLGKTVRWYYAKGETGTINYKKNGNKVPKTDGAKPLMELPERLPADIDLSVYITDAKGILDDIGAQE